ncbi:MAG: hypothetical protein ACR2PL_20820 [Dehalococcoidia bacterium]
MQGRKHGVRRVALWLFGFGFALLALSLVGASAHASGPELVAPAATPEAALEQFITLTHGSYAGDCAATRSPQDLGKLCTRFLQQRGSLYAYLAGRTFSEFSIWIFVSQSEGAWTVVTTVPLANTGPSDTIPWPPQAGLGIAPRASPVMGAHCSNSTGNETRSV